MAPFQYQMLRSTTKGNRPSGRLYGEPYVNFADNQIGVINSSGGAVDLIGIPLFSTGASYVAGQAVAYSGSIYIANVAVSPGAFNPAQWTTFLKLTGGTMTGPIVLPNNVSLQSLDTTGVARGLIWMDNAGTVHVRSNNGNAGSLLYLESRPSGAYSLQCDPNGQIFIPVTTNSSSPSNGALVVGGGIGVGADIRTNGNMYFLSGNGILNANGQWVLQLAVSGYNILYDTGGISNIYLSTSQDLFRSNQFQFINSAATVTFAEINSSGLQIDTGNLYLTTNTGIQNLSTGQWVLALNSGGYNILYDTSNNADLWLGSNQNVYRSNTHVFQSVGGSVTFANINSSGIQIAPATSANANNQGALQVVGGASIQQNLWVSGDYYGSYALLMSQDSQYNNIYNPDGNYAIRIGRPDQSNPITFYYADRHAFMGMTQPPEIAYIGLGGVTVLIGGIVNNGGPYNGNRSATSWMFQITNTHATIGDLGGYWALGGAATANDASSVYQVYTDPNVTGYCGWIERNGPNAVVYASGSDARWKDTVEEKSTRGLEKLKQIHVKDFKWKNSEDNTVYQGIYAQELQKIYPEAVAIADIRKGDAEATKTGEQAWGIDYGRLTPLLIQAIQDLSDEVKSLRAEVETLRAR